MEHHQNYQAKSIRPSYKSWGEKQIARLLDRYGISFRYEYPTAVVDRGKVRIYYPDFTLPEYGIIIEYFGVNGKSAYDEQAKHKMKVYQQAGIEGLFLTRDSLRGDWPTRIVGQIEKTLSNRLEKLHNHYNGAAASRAGANYRDY